MYEVQDAASGNDFGHMEMRQGDVARGSYHVLLPDGRMQKVKNSKIGLQSRKILIFYLLPHNTNADVHSPSLLNGLSDIFDLWLISKRINTPGDFNEQYLEINNSMMFNIYDSFV